MCRMMMLLLLLLWYSRYRSSPFCFKEKHKCFWSRGGKCSFRLSTDWSLLLARFLKFVCFGLSRFYALPFCLRMHSRQLKAIRTIKTKCIRCTMAIKSVPYKSINRIKTWWKRWVFVVFLLAKSKPKILSPRAGSWASGKRFSCWSK